MAWQRRWLSAALLCLGCWQAGGCVNVPEELQPKRSLANDISQPALPAVFRSQRAETPGVTLQNPKPAAQTFVPQPPPAPEKDIQQTSAMASRGTVRIRIRAWVNGRPIFDEELCQLAGPAMRHALSLSEENRTDDMTKMIKAVLDRIVDQELMYQDAVKKLKKASPHSLDKLNEFVDHEFNKTVQRMREKKVPENDIRNVEPIARRMMERELVATEYARTLIKQRAERVHLDEIAEYYDAHKKEFRTVDRIEWQDIFIRLSPNLPTVQDAKRFAEELINRCRTPEDFTQLMVYNEGVTKNSGGEGLGNLRGQIQPRELEESLFKLRQGEIGPVIPLVTGVHLIRVTKREYEGQRPLDYNVQKIIRKKLENEIADHEYRQLVRELKTRASIHVERDSP